MKQSRVIILLLAAGSAVLLDRITKIWAVNELRGEGVRSYLNDTIRIVYAENTGAFLSLGSGLSDTIRFIVLTVLPVLVLLYVLYTILFSTQMSRYQAAAFSFIVGGGGSNVYDRILEGKVVDFMNMGLGGLRTGIFNVADMAIMLGLFMMIPLLFRKPPHNEEPTEKPAA